MSRSSRVENALFMAEVKGEGIDCQISIHNTIKVCRRASLNKPHWSSKQMRYCSKRANWMAVLSATNRKQRLKFAQAHHNFAIEDRIMLIGSKTSEECVHHLVECIPWRILNAKGCLSWYTQGVPNKMTSEYKCSAPWINI